VVSVEMAPTASMSAPAVSSPEQVLGISTMRTASNRSSPAAVRLQADAASVWAVGVSTGERPPPRSLTITA
jgi:hypothetical protein